MLRVAQKIPASWQAMDAVLLDQQQLVSAATSEQFFARGWKTQAVAADVFAWLAHPAAPVFDVIVANLFLHHFDSVRLMELLALVARRARVVIACEPQRSSRALLGSRLLGVIGCNDVTRHDAVVSVRAGFTDRELSALWPAATAWTLREFPHGLFSHCFVACRANSAHGAGRAHSA